MTARRQLTVTVLATAVAAGVVLFAAGRDWQSIMTHRIAPLPPMTVRHSGADLSPWLPALGAVGLAGAGALIATRGLLRMVVGGLLTVVGAGILAAVGGVLGHGVDKGWPVLTMVAAVVIAAAGVATVRFSGRWPEMSARYERAGGDPKPKASEAALWDALDRGEDPTGEPDREQ